jgi:hypothetical protein
VTSKVSEVPDEDFSYKEISVLSEATDDFAAESVAGEDEDIGDY